MKLQKIVEECKDYISSHKKELSILAAGLALDYITTLTNIKLNGLESEAMPYIKEFSKAIGPESALGILKGVQGSALLGVMYPTYKRGEINISKNVFKYGGLFLCGVGAWNTFNMISYYLAVH